MPYINEIQCESIQTGVSENFPISTVEIWPSLDPTMPFSVQNFGVANMVGATNQVGLYNGVGAWNQLGAYTGIGFGVDVGGHTDAQPALVSAATNMDFSSVSGNLWGSWELNGVPIETTSDVNLKKNIIPLENCLDKILNLQGVEYDRIDYEKHEIGLIAQEVEKTIPELVTENSNGIKLMHYGNLTAVLVEAIKEQQKQIEDLKETVKKLSTPCEKCLGVCYDV